MSEDTWKPVSLELLNAILADDEQNIPDTYRELWNKIKVTPEKWAMALDQKLYGVSNSDRYWIVGKYKNHVIWYQDVEEGFNCSPYFKPGVIAEMGWETDELWVSFLWLEKALGRLS